MYNRSLKLLIKFTKRCIYRCSRYCIFCVDICVYFCGTRWMKQHGWNSPWWPWWVAAARAQYCRVINKSVRYKLVNRDQVKWHCWAEAEQRGWILSALTPIHVFLIIIILPKFFYSVFLSVCYFVFPWQNSLHFLPFSSKCTKCTTTQTRHLGGAL